MNDKPQINLPENTGGQSAYMEHRGNEPQRGEFNDAQLAEATGEGVQRAHAQIEDVTEHRTTDLLDED
jgi:hypothetical protein